MAGVPGAASGLTRVRRVASSRADLLLLAAVLVGVQFLPKHVPIGLWGIGVVAGIDIAFHAMAIILVLRSDRIINFAQLQVGALSGMLFFQLVAHSELFVLLHAVCGN